MHKPLDTGKVYCAKEEYMDVERPSTLRLDDDVDPGAETEDSCTQRRIRRPVKDPVGVRTAAAS